MIDLKDRFNVIECNKINKRAETIDFKQYVNIELKRLVDMGFIPDKIPTYCPTHFLNFEAIPLTIFSNKIIYTQCPRCNMEIERERSGYLSEAEKEKIKIEGQKHLEYILSLRGVPQIFFTKKVDYSLGLFAKFSHLLQGELKKNLIISGGVGSGKSMFVYELCKAYFNINKYASVINYNKLVAEFKSNFSNIDTLHKSYKNVDCLCIDEIDNVKNSDYNVIDELISYFYDSCKKLVFVGNVNVNDFKSILSKNSVSRLENNTSILLSGEIDLRKEIF